MRSGILLVDKAEGMTSHDVVALLRKKLNISAVGHAGTLDPLATGLLICLVGEGTKISQYIMDGEKSYDVTVELGINTNSGDITGEVIQRYSEALPEKEKILKVGVDLKGTLVLPVPKFSAIKVGGKKLYELARKDEEMIVPTKSMDIFSVDPIDGNEIRFQIRCGKGTYIRSWVEELGRRLGCGATVKALRRLSSGSFNLSNAVTVEAIKSFPNGEGGAVLGPKVIEMRECLQGWPELRLIGNEIKMARNGQISKGALVQAENAQFDHGIKLLGEGNSVLGILVRENEKIKVGRIFNQ